VLTYEALLPRLDAQVESALLRQVVDENSPDCGGFVSEGVAGGTNLSTVASLGYAYLLAGSRYHQSPELVDRILLAARFGRAARRASGRFDLVTTNFDSAPDTGFLVQAISPVVAAARRGGESGDTGAAEIAEVLGEIVLTAAPGMASGGFHTPNHRWVLVSALSQAAALYPHLDVMGTVEAYLSETVDINGDGEYIERSTSVYNAVCNRSLRIAADALGRPELLEPVRRNLDLSYHLLHADGSVVTSVSRRQDRGRRAVPIGLVDSFYALARMDGNGYFAAVADWLYGLSPGGLPWTLHPFLEHPEWRTDDLEREPLPTEYSRVYETAELWRVRRQRMSATVASGLTSPFSLRFGEVELTSVKVCASYFAVSQFRGEGFKASEGRVELTHAGRGRSHDSPVYYHPLGRPVSPEAWMDTRRQRDVYALPPLVMRMTAEETPGGFDLRVVTEHGLDRVPFQIACDFAQGGELELDCGVLQCRQGETVLLKSGFATYHVGADAVSVGPGAHAHRMWAMRGSEAAPEAFRVLLTFLTPVDTVLKVRYGRWSAGQEALVPAGGQGDT